MTFDRESQSVPADAHVGEDSAGVTKETATAFGTFLSLNEVQGKCIELEGDLGDQKAVLFHQQWQAVSQATGKYTTVETIPTQ